MAFMARRALVEREHGAAKFDEVVRAIAKTEAIFRSPVLATTKIPMGSFMRFNQALIDTLYNGDQKANFALGEQSADYALNGPYKHFVTNRSIDAFVGSAPSMYKNYFDEGEAKAERRGRDVNLELFDIPAAYRCLYIEYGIMGYFRRGLEMVSGGMTKMTAKKGFSKGDDAVLYVFELTNV